MENEIIFATAIMLLAGLLMGRLGKLAKLPNVTGYLIAGLLPVSYTHLDVYKRQKLRRITRWRNNPS